MACGAYAFLLGLVATYFNWGNALVDTLGSLYLGYNATLLGSFIGGIWALVDGFIGGFIVYWLYSVISGGQAKES